MGGRISTRALPQSPWWSLPGPAKLAPLFWPWPSLGCGHITLLDPMTLMVVFC